MTFQERPDQISYQDVSTYLSKKHVPDALVTECVQFLKHLSRENHEREIGKRTIDVILHWSWHVTEEMLDQIYVQAPEWIDQFVEDVLFDVNMPTESELTAPVRGYSLTAKRAYIFLSESVSRAIYSLVFSPEAYVKACKTQNVSVGA